MFRELGLRARAKKQHAKLIKQQQQQSKQAESQSGEGQLVVVDAAAAAEEVETVKATLSDAIGQEPARVYMTFENLSYTV